MNYLHANPWQKKMIRSLEVNYQKHPYYSEVLEVIEPLIRNQESNIADYNISTVIEISRLLGLDQSEFKRSSQIHKTGAANELLITLTQSAGGDTYMCGGGAEGYQNPSAFEASGIYLQFQNFSHPTYPQFRSTAFTSGLSVIDAAMNMGWKELSAMIKDS